MNTAPFDESVAELITGPHVQSATVTATPAGGSPITLNVVRGRLSWDESRAPRVSGNLTCSPPDDPAALALLDPRKRVRVKVTVAYTLASGVVDSHQVADLHLRRRSLTRVAGELELEVASDEAQVIDSSQNVAITIGAHPDTVALTDGAAWISSMIIAGLWNVGEAAPVVNRSGVLPAAAERPYDVVDQWGTISDVADQLDLDVYDPGDRVFRITARPSVAAESVLIVAGGSHGILLDATETIDRADWANFVVLRYEWTDSAGVRKTVWGTARATGGPLAVTTVGYKIWTDVRDTGTTQAAANAAALAMLTRMLSRSRGLTITAVSAWWVLPGATITYQTQAGAQERHLVAAVDFNLERYTMTVRTRLPDTDQTLGV